jgi:hypothetical protein
MKVANGFETGAVIGLLIDMKVIEKLEAHIADAFWKGEPPDRDAEFPGLVGRGCRSRGTRRR